MRLWRIPAIGHRRSGGQLMHKPLRVLVATAAIVFAACTPSASSTSSEGAGNSQPAATPVLPTTTPVNLFDSTYAPAAGR